MKKLFTLWMTTLFLSTGFFVSAQDYGNGFQVEYNGDNYLRDSDSLNFSFTVYNLDNTDEQSLHRNDSICKLFGCDQYQPKTQLYSHIKGDSTHFLFIRTLTTCCPDPIGKIESSMDTLKLTYTLPPEGPFCDAFCPYMFIYSIPTREINVRIVSIK